MQLIQLKKMSVADYAAIDAVRSTEIKAFAKNQKLFHAYRNGEVHFNKEIMDRGRVMHSVCLENDTSQIAVFEPTKNYMKPKASKEWKQFVLDNPDKVCMTPDEVQDVNDARDRFWSNPEIREVMFGAMVEQVVCAQCPETGLWMKAQLDGVNPETGLLIEYKTCADASEWGFSRQGAKLKYNLQIAHYIYCYTLATGNQIKNVKFIAEEKRAPFLTEVHWLSDDDVLESLRFYKNILNQLKVCLNDNEWRGYKKHERLFFPPYAYEFEEINLEDL